MSTIDAKLTLKEQFAVVKEAADNGDPKVYAMLASKYFEGAGTERSLEQAEYWAKKALNEGGDDLMAAQILYWIDRATEDQRTDAESEAMKILNRGSFAMQYRNYPEAFKCFMKAARMGHTAAMNNLSYCYFHGLGTKMNKVAAFEWMKKAAEGGYQSAYYPLAAKYYLGNGTVKSPEKALFWAKKALEGDNQYVKDAQELLVMLGEK